MRERRPGCRCAHPGYEARCFSEKIQGQPQRAIGLRLAVGSAAEPREGVIGAGILVDRHQRIGREPPLEQIVDFRLHPAILHRHVQHEGPMQVLRLADVVLDVGAVIGDRAIDVGAAAHQVAELAAEAVADRADIAVALLQVFQEMPGVHHVAHGEVVVEVVVEIERLAAHVRDCGRTVRRRAPDARTGPAPGRRSPLRQIRARDGAWCR